MRKKWWISVGLGVFWFALMGCQSESKEVLLWEETRSQTVSGQETVTLATWMVHVCGEVKNPGVYEVPENSRVIDAVEAAGGLTEEAFLIGCNLAAMLKDGQQVVIPDEEGFYAAQAGADAIVNLNTAGEDALMTLPGIGEAKAKAIVAYRQKQGAFEAIEDIMKVSGIGEAMFDRIKDRICT